MERISWQSGIHLDLPAVARTSIESSHIFAGQQDNHYFNVEAYRRVCWTHRVATFLHLFYKRQGISYRDSNGMRESIRRYKEWEIDVGFSAK